MGSRSVTLNYDAKNLLAGLTQNGASVSYTYDALGNIRSKGTQSFTFDLGNRLKASSLGGNYVYDGLGRRVQLQSTDGSTRLYAYSQAGQVLWSTSSGGPRASSTTAYIYLGGKQIAEANSATGVQYVHTDALGSPVARTNASGAVLNRTRFEAYGYPAAGTKPSPATSQIGFTGHVQDAESELVYMQQRYYDPIAGRFLSGDPVVTDANTGGMFGRYHYADNSPYAKVDPDGRQAIPFMLPPPPPTLVPGRMQQGPDGPIPASRPSLPKIHLPTLPITTPLGMVITIAQIVSTAGTTPTQSTSGGDNTNPYTGPVTAPVVVVDQYGNAIPVEKGQSVKGSPNGDYQQVLGSDGMPTGDRMDRGGHKGQKDPKAQAPHGHRPGVTTPDGNPHLPINEPRKPLENTP